MQEYIKQSDKVPVIEMEHILDDDGNFIAYTSRSIIKLADQFPSLSIVSKGSFYNSFVNDIGISVYDIGELNLSIETKINPIYAWKDTYMPQEIPIWFIADYLKQFEDIPLSTFVLQDENQNPIDWMIMYHPNIEIVGPEVK